MEKITCPVRTCSGCQSASLYGDNMLSRHFYHCAYYKITLNKKAKKCDYFICKRKGDYPICDRCSG